MHETVESRRQPGGVFSGPVSQIGYVVPDVGKAIQGWIAAGVGPWFLRRDFPVTASYRGTEITARISTGFAYSGSLEIEITQPGPGSQGPYADFLNETGGGYHELAWFTEDFDGASANAHAAGWEPIWVGGERRTTRFTYFESPDSPAPIMELVEMTSMFQQRVKAARYAAENWDGCQPIRELA